MKLTPKQKADQLIETFSIKCDGVIGSAINTILAIECALIAVDEIISVTHNDPFDRKNNRSIFDKQFWQEVKSELEKQQ